MKVSLKLDADDQERIAQEEREKLTLVAKQAQTPKWERSPSEIADDIASDFFQVASLNHADLRRQVIKEIEAERVVARYYMSQMGRWWSRLNK